MKGKYLINTNDWFIAPDGQQYQAVWGEVEILEDDFLGVKTNRNSANWYAKIGNDEEHIIVAGCQIHYAAKCSDRPSDGKTLGWSMDASNYREEHTPTRIYFID